MLGCGDFSLLPAVGGFISPVGATIHTNITFLVVRCCTEAKPRTMESSHRAKGTSGVMCESQYPNNSLDREGEAVARNNSTEGWNKAGALIPMGPTHQLEDNWSPVFTVKPHEAYSLGGFPSRWLN